MRQIRGFFFIFSQRGLTINRPVVPMNLTHHLRQSLEDFYFSKSEKNVLKSILAGELHDAESVNRIRAKVLELAAEQVTEKNYRLVMQWVKDVNQVLQQRADQQSRAFFSPGEDCRQAIIRQMNLSLRELNICVFTISDDEISRAILAAHRKGVGVRIITDNEKSLDLGSDIDKFAREGIAVKMDNSKNHMHHKFMISDKQSVITGSYNWTLSAARFNHENILLTKDPAVVDSYTNSFDRLWQEMVAYDGASR
jgi:phosphatidylserine/phosphatidylglycerophosphate/cardiolipin synthase-like enzyme